MRRLLVTDYQKQVRDVISSQRLENRVRFVGMGQDVVQLYAAADVVAFPAMEMHQARPILEAGAMAKPVVVSDFECYREFVQDGVNGAMAPAGDVQALARQLRRILEDRELAARLGEANYRVTCAKHNGDVNGKRYVGLYERVAALK